MKITRKSTTYAGLRQPLSAFGLAFGLTENKGGRVAAVRCDEGDEKDTNDSFVYFVTRPFVPFSRVRIAYMSHRSDDYDTNPENRKTYGSVLVRFFGRKMHFAPFFRALEKIQLATHTA